MSKPNELRSISGIRDQMAKKHAWAASVGNAAGMVTFGVAWVYLTVEIGLVAGLLFGWIPAAILAGIAGGIVFETARH